jgi:hypothetical protein
MYVYSGAGWQAAGSSVNGTSDRQTYTASSGQTVFAATYDTGYIDVYLNGVKLVAGTDFTATNGTSITLASGATINDVIDIVAYGTFVLADHYDSTASDARYVQVAGDTMTGNLSFGDNNKAIFGAGSDLQIYHDATTSYIRNINNNNLMIAGSDLFLKSNDLGQTYFHAVEAGAISINSITGTNLTIGGANKLQVTATGIDVNGTVVADGLTVDGNVGIGTSSPTTKLQSKGGSISSPTDNAGLIANASASFVVNHGNDYGLYTGYVASANDAIGIAATRTGGTALPLSLQPFGGNVGIGTSSPDAQGGNQSTIFNLEGSDNIVYFSGGSGGNAIDDGLAIEGVATGVTSGDKRTGSILMTRANTSTTSLDSKITFYTTSSGTHASKMTLDASGNLGIGTASPDGKLHIQDGSAGVVTAAAGANDLVIETSQTSGMSILCGAGWASIIQFGGGTDNNIGNIGVNDTSGIMTMGTAKAGGTLALRTADSVNALTIDASQNLAVTSGNLSFANGQGIDFSATAGTGTSELLDDYEEGTWTPVWSPATGAFSSVTYRFQNAVYTKIGNVVYISCQLSSDAITVDTGSGNISIGGLPFTAVAVQNSSMAVSSANDFAGDFPNAANVGPSSQTLRLYYRTAVNGATSLLNVTDLSTATSYGNAIDLSGFYYTAA